MSHYLRGREAMTRGDWAAAEAAFTEAIGAGEQPAAALRARVTARVRAGNWGGAADDLERWIRDEQGEPSPLDIEYARTLRLAQSLPSGQAARLLSEFSYEDMEKAVMFRAGPRFVSIDDFLTRAAALAAEKYAAAPPEPLRQYLSGKIPGRLYRVPALQALPAMDMWARCEWWVFHGLGAADVVHELVSGQDLSKEEPQVPSPPYQKGTDPGTLAERCPIEWAFVHHALLVMSHDLAEELADEQPQLKSELPAIRDAAVKPLVYLGFGIGLEAQGI